MGRLHQPAKIRPPMIPFIRTLSFAAVLVTPAAWSAQDSEQHSRLPESVQRVERETGGKVLQVMPIQRGDREVYRMKVLTPEGRVRVVQDDPRHPREETPREAAEAGQGEGDDRNTR
jgi:hypothetical protein